MFTCLLRRRRHQLLRGRPWKQCSPCVSQAAAAAAAASEEPRLEDGENPKKSERGAAAAAATRRLSSLLSATPKSRWMLARKHTPVALKNVPQCLSFSMVLKAIKAETDWHSFVRLIGLRVLVEHDNQTSISLEKGVRAIKATSVEASSISKSGTWPMSSLNLGDLGVTSE